MAPSAHKRTVCVVPECTSDDSSRFKFFAVPLVSSPVFKKWIKLCPLSGNRTEKICELHFSGNDFTYNSRQDLRTNAVPGVKLPQTEPFFQRTGSCCVAGCNTKNTSLLKPFPTNQKQRASWIKALKLPEDASTVWLRVCKKHFSQKDFTIVTSVYLKPAAIPSKKIRRIIQNPHRVARQEDQTTDDPQSDTTHSELLLPKSNRMCSVYKCSSRAGKGVFLHSYPAKDDKRYPVWIHRLRNGKKPSKNAKVCNKHFIASDYVRGHKRLTDTAIPSVNLPVGTVYTNQHNIYDKPRVSYRRSAAYQHDSTESGRITILQDSAEREPFSLSTAEETDVDHMAVPESPGCPTFTTDSISAPPSEWTPLGDLTTSHNEVNGVGEENFNEKCPRSHDAHVDHQSGTSSKLKPVSNNPAKRVSATFSDFLVSDYAVNVWTGIETLKLLEVLCKCTKDLEDAVYKNNYSLHCTDRVILVLIKLKQNLSFAALGILFGVHLSTVSRYFSQTIHVLADILCKFIVFTPKEEILQNIPLCFRGAFANVTMVLDCTEVPVPLMRCLNCRIATYSQYKGRHTAKFLLGVTPAGVISFCSDGYSGKASDKFIFNDEQVIDLLTPHIDELMVDKGFTIEEELSTKGIKLHIPPFLRGPRLTPAQAGLNEDIAKARIHIERVIQRIKIFSILKETLDYSVLSHLDQIMLIICAIVNLSKPVLRDDKF